MSTFDTVGITQTVHRFRNVLSIYGINPVYVQKKNPEGTIIGVLMEISNFNQSKNNPFRNDTLIKFLFGSQGIEKKMKTFMERSCKIREKSIEFSS